MTLTVISYGGGVQSTAMLVLATQGKLGYDVDAALFSNVGDDSEHPATLEYVRNVSMPRAAEAGIPVHEIKKVNREGVHETLVERLTKVDGNSIPIPARMEGGAPTNRACTADWKISVVAKWLKQNGATAQDPANVCIGISTDEIQRVNPNTAPAHERIVYPLIELEYDRSACAQIIADAGWPVPPKSSCYFCPFHRPSVWSEMRRDEPELFFKSVDLERQLIEKRRKIGKEPVYLTRFGKPLDEAVDEAQDMLPLGEWDACDSGHCMT